MYCPGVYCVSREALCRNPMLALCNLLSSTQPCRAALVFPDAYLEPLNSGSHQALPLSLYPPSSSPQSADSLSSRMEPLLCHLLCSISQESSSFFIWCLTSWKLLFHILSFKKFFSCRRSNLVPVIPSWLKVNVSAIRNVFLLYFNVNSQCFFLIYTST